MSGNKKYKLPGYIATGMLALSTTLWTFWSVGEMFYEGWWGKWTNRLPYLVPAFICWLLTFIALSWPRLGGWIIILIGGGFTIWRWMRQYQLGLLTLRWALSFFPISGLLILVGVLFFLEAHYRRKRRMIDREPPKKWVSRNLLFIIAYTPPLLTAIVVTALFAPLVLSRYDDGDRDARLIRGNGVSLIWAPSGPGWSEGVGPSQDEGKLLDGANLSWNAIAFYGVPPVGFGDKTGYTGRNATETDMQVMGLCRYLSEDGTALLHEAQDIWRMPSTDEIVRSLVRKGENAGCSWDGVSMHAECNIQPNKDSPLWAPEASVIYYLAADEYDEDSAWYVPYTGGGLFGGVIGHQKKTDGNSRHGHRCVKNP